VNDPINVAYLRLRSTQKCTNAAESDLSFTTEQLPADLFA